MVITSTNVCGRTPPRPQGEQGVRFYPELDIAGREESGFLCTFEEQERVVLKTEQH